MAQYLVLLPGTAVTLSNADAPDATLVALVVLFIVVVLLIGPSFALLFTLQGRRLLHADEAGMLPAANLVSRAEPPQPTPPPCRLHGRAPAPGLRNPNPAIPRPPSSRRSRRRVRRLHRRSRRSRTWPWRSQRRPNS